MPKHIDADKLKEAFGTDLEHLSEIDEHTVFIVINDIDEMPAADVAPVVHGRWIRDPRQWSTSQCSVCGSPAPWKRGCSNVQCLTPHCPTCGALMDGKDEDNG